MPRLIYSLKYDLVPADSELEETDERCDAEADSPSPHRQLIVRLRPDGSSPLVRAVNPQQRVIDMRVGDWLVHAQLGKMRIGKIVAFRDSWFAADAAPDLRDGYYLPRASPRTA